MKKYIKPIIELTLFFAGIPYILLLLGSETGNGLLMALLVLGNPLFLFSLNKKYSTLHRDIVILCLSLIAILLQMKFFLLQFIVEYIAFYMIMAFLGMRLGGVKRKMREAVVKPESFTE